MVKEVSYVIVIVEHIEKIEEEVKYLKENIKTRSKVYLKNDKVMVGLSRSD